MKLEKAIFSAAFPSKAKEEVIKKESSRIRDNSCYRRYQMGVTSFDCLVVESSESSGLILYFHSNGCVLGPSLLSHLQQLSSLFSKTIVAIEYPGYGLSEDACTVNNFFAVTEAAANYFQTARYEKESLILFGRSLGCVAACYLASILPHVAGVILESAFSSVKDIMGVSYYVLNKQSRDLVNRLSCTRYLEKVSCPKCIIYGTCDQFSRSRSQRKLLTYFHSSDMVCRYPGFHHNNIPRGSRHGTCLFASPQCCMPCVYAPSTEPVDADYKSSLQLFINIVDAVSAGKEIYCHTLDKHSIEMVPLPMENEEVAYLSATETSDCFS